MAAERGMCSRTTTTVGISSWVERNLRVVKVTRGSLSPQDETPTVTVVREHIPLSAAMQLIVTDRQLPDGMYEQYLIEPEND